MAHPNDRRYRYYDIVMAAFVTVLLCSNLIGPAKTSAIDLGLPIFPSLHPERGALRVVPAGVVDRLALEPGPQVRFADEPVGGGEAGIL